LKRYKTPKAAYWEKVGSFVWALAAILLGFVLVLQYALGGQERSSRVSVRRFGDLRVSLRLNRPEFYQGDSVGVKLTVKNLGKNYARLDFLDNNEFDVLVQRDLNLGLVHIPLSVWERSNLRLTPPRGHRCLLAPGEAKVYRTVWDQTDFTGRPVSSGRYIVTGILRMRDARVILSVRGKTIAGNEKKEF